MKGCRYEINARGEGYDPLQCREPSIADDPESRIRRGGRVGLGSSLVSEYLQRVVPLP